MFKHSCDWEVYDTPMLYTNENKDNFDTRLDYGVSKDDTKYIYVHLCTLINGFSISNFSFSRLYHLKTPRHIPSSVSVMYDHVSLPFTDNIPNIPNRKLSRSPVDGPRDYDNIIS